MYVKLSNGVMQSVVLSVRPPISLPQTTVPPAILEELVGEISTLASVYHKPAATFIGKGRLGADEMHKKSLEYVYLSHFILMLIS